MTTAVKELFGDQQFGKSSTGNSAKRAFHVSGATGPDDAMAATGIPAYGDYYPGSSTLKAAGVSADTDGRDDLYKVVVDYVYSSASGGGKPKTPSAGDEWWTLDLSGQTVNIQAAYSQTSYGADAIDVDTLVNVKYDEKKPTELDIDGVDVYAPGGTLTITTWRAPDDVTAGSSTSFVQECMAEIGKYNSGTYYGFAAGELLFTGVRIVNRVQGTEEELVELEFAFAISPNKSSAELPTFIGEGEGSGEDGVITITGGKKGWQYLWIMPVLATGIGSVENATAIRVRGAYVADVYKSSDFSAFELSGELS